MHDFYDSANCGVEVKTVTKARTRLELHYCCKSKDKAGHKAELAFLETSSMNRRSVRLLSLNLLVIVVKTLLDYSANARRIKTVFQSGILEQFQQNKRSGS